MTFLLYRKHFLRKQWSRRHGFGPQTILFSETNVYYLTVYCYGRVEDVGYRAVLIAGFTLLGLRVWTWTDYLKTQKEGRIIY
jgi:hypothetical protein